MGLRMMPFFKGKKGFQFAGGGNLDKFDDLPVATTTSIGCVKADGTTINVNSSGTISTTALLKKSTMPEASAAELGNVYMYTGADTETFTSGHVYKCVSDEDPETPTYSWSQVELEDPYTLPTATTSTLGGFKVGEGLSIDANGVLSNLIKFTFGSQMDSISMGSTSAPGVYYIRFVQDQNNFVEMEIGTSTLFGGDGSIHLYVCIAGETKHYKIQGILQ